MQKGPTMSIFVHFVPFQLPFFTSPLFKNFCQNQNIYPPAYYNPLQLDAGGSQQSRFEKHSIPCFQ